MSIGFTAGISHEGDARNAVRRSRSSVNASIEIAGQPRTNSAHAGLNIQAGSPHMLSSGRRTKMYSPYRSFLRLWTRRFFPANGCHR